MLAAKCVPPRMAITVCSMRATGDDQSGSISIAAPPKIRADNEHKTAMCMYRAFFSGLILLPIDESSMKIPKRLGKSAVMKPVVNQKTRPRVIIRKPMAAVS